MAARFALPEGLALEAWRVGGRDVYAYLPADATAGERLPLVLDLNCTTGSRLRLPAWRRALSVTACRPTVPTDNSMLY